MGALSQEQPPFEVDENLRNYLIRAFTDVDNQLKAPSKFPERKEMPYKPQVGDVHYFGNPATHNYDAAITLEGYWGLTSTGWKQLDAAGGGGGSPTLQDAYDNSAGAPQIVNDLAGGTFAIQDNATPTGADLFAVRNNSSNDLLAVGVAGVDFGATFAPTSDSSYDVGSSVNRVRDIFGSRRTVLVDGVGTITPGSGRGLLAGYSGSNGEVAVNGLVDSFNIAAGRAFTGGGYTARARASGAGCATFADAVGYSGNALVETDTNSSAGCFIAGSAYAYYGTAQIRIPGASRKGSFASGYVTSLVAGITNEIEVEANGGFAQGMVRGTTSGNNRLRVGASGGFAQGYIRTLGTVTNVDTSVLEVTGNGGFAQGYIRTNAGGTGTILASGSGSFAHGYVRAQGEIGNITASGRGAFAAGHARDTTVNSYITASGNGSFAFGYAFNATIAATAANAFQFGIGSNAQADSMQIGNSGIRLKGTTGAPGTLQNGDIWVNAGYVYIRSNGVSVQI